jgi:hypothetical protein
MKNTILIINITVLYVMKICLVLRFLKLIDSDNKVKDIHTAIKVINHLIDVKHEQIKQEPNEPIWKDELSQLLKISGLLDMEKESY